MVLFAGTFHLSDFCCLATHNELIPVWIIFYNKTKVSLFTIIKNTVLGIFGHTNQNISGNIPLESDITGSVPRFMKYTDNLSYENFHFISLSKCRSSIYRQISLALADYHILEHYQA